MRLRCGINRLDDESSLGFQNHPIPIGRQSLRHPNSKRERCGLNDPIPVQFVRYVGNVLQGAAYVYSNIGGTWTFVKKLVADDAVGLGRFAGAWRHGRNMMAGASLAKRRQPSFSGEAKLRPGNLRPMRLRSPLVTRCSGRARA